MFAYISFDVVPAPKGASTHIEAFAKALASAFGPIHLVTATPAPVPPPQVERWPGILHTELPACGASLIDRVLCFRRYLRRWLADHPCNTIQFRSIFEGFPLLSLSPRPRLVFEVNGLPSVELKYRYPKAADDRELMRKLVAQERACLDAAERIVTPSHVTARFLRRPHKTCVIPNGVDTSVFTPALRMPPDLDLLYFGTLAPWQGVDLAIRSLAQLRVTHPAVRLTVVGSGTSRQKQALTALAAKLHVADAVDVLPPVDRFELAARLRASFAVVAPLPVNDRNTRQGCCPLKILEGMAAGVPVISSDLPVVRDLGEHGRDFLLVKPGSVDQITAAVQQLAAAPSLWHTLARNASARIETCFTWQKAGRGLVELHRQLAATEGTSTLAAASKPA